MPARAIEVALQIASRGAIPSPSHDSAVPRASRVCSRRSRAAVCQLARAHAFANALALFVPRPFTPLASAAEGPEARHHRIAQLILRMVFSPASSAR
jgi:hypothetical protein